MTYAAGTALGKRLEARLEPWLDTPGDLARFSDAIGQMLQNVLELAEEEGEDGSAGYVPAWGKLFEVKVCPYKDLGFLGQFVGVAIPTKATEAEARKLVENESGLERGTRKAIEMAIERVLGAGEPFLIKERENKAGEAKAYWFLVIVKKGKVTTALKEAIEAVKPGGVQFSILEVENAWLEGAAGKKWSEIGAGKKWTGMLEGEY